MYGQYLLFGMVIEGINPPRVPALMTASIAAWLGRRWIVHLGSCDHASLFGSSMWFLRCKHLFVM
jgi:hypothetical protein